MAGDYYYSHISGRARVGGVDIPAADITVKYALNEVPTATVKAAVGWDESGNQSPVVKAMESADYFTPMEVFIKDDGDSPFGAGEFKAFEGFVTGPRNDATAKQSVGAVIDGEGILGELRLGNKLSWAIHSSSPGGLFEPCIKEKSKTGNTGGIYLDGRDVYPVGNVAADLWTNGILPMFVFLANNGNRLAFGMKGPPNTRALAALSKISTSPAAPLAITTGAAGAAKALKKGVAVHLADISSGTSFWDTLVSFCATWSMALVPRATNSYIVPFMEAAQHYYTTITLDHIFSVSALDFIQRANCRGVVLVGMGRDAYNMTDASKRKPGFLGIADGVSLGITDISGQFKAYQWPDAYGTAITNPATIKRIPRSRTNIRSLKRPNVPPPESGTSAVKDVQLDAFMDKVAEARLRRDLVAARMCNVVCPLRFDICPGSQIRLEFIGSGEEASYMYGVVTSVEIRVNAEQPYASTAFAVSHLRTEAQQHSAATSSVHPIFGKLFIGDSL